jgi:putative flippase GtrA
MIYFIRYALIGLANTTIHWVFFYILYFFEIKQFFCNFIGFSCAALFSYVMNMKYNFKLKQRVGGFILFYIIMGVLSLIIGLIADGFLFKPLCTLILSSVLSLVLGYIFSKHLVFRD